MGHDRIGRLAPPLAVAVIAVALSCAADQGDDPKGTGFDPVDAAIGVDVSADLDSGSSSEPSSGGSETGSTASDTGSTSTGASDSGSTGTTGSVDSGATGTVGSKDSGSTTSTGASDSGSTGTTGAVDSGMATSTDAATADSGALCPQCAGCCDATGSNCSDGTSATTCGVGGVVCQNCKTSGLTCHTGGVCR